MMFNSKRAIKAVAAGLAAVALSMSLPATADAATPKVVANKPYVHRGIGYATGKVTSTSAKDRLMITCALESWEKARWGRKAGWQNKGGGFFFSKGSRSARSVYDFKPQRGKSYRTRCTGGKEFQGRKPTRYSAPYTHR